MKRILTAAVLIPLVLLILFRAPFWLFALFIAVVAVICTREYLALVEAHGIVPFRRLTLLASATLFLWTATDSLVNSLENQSHSYYLRMFASSFEILIPLLVVTLPLFFLLRGMTRPNLSSVLPGAAASTFALVYPCFPLLAIVFLRYGHFGESLLLYLLLTVWAGDIAAYYVGRALGHKPLAARISPKKSWEGAIASFLAGGLVGALILHYLTSIHSWLFSAGLLSDRIAHSRFEDWSFPMWLSVLLSLSINVAAQFGDLVESMLKRGAGVKDSGSILPGHGGILDRIDALLFAAPVLWGYYLFLRFLPF
jgi:phosphatidate cytidylyltransferase